MCMSGLGGGSTSSLDGFCNLLSIGSIPGCLDDRRLQAGRAPAAVHGAAARLVLSAAQRSAPVPSSPPRAPLRPPQPGPGKRQPLRCFPAGNLGRDRGKPGPPPQRGWGCGMLGVPCVRGGVQGGVVRNRFMFTPRAGYGVPDPVCGLGGCTRDLQSPCVPMRVLGL